MKREVELYSNWKVCSCIIMSPSCVYEQILNGIIRRIQIVKNAIAEKNLRETQSSPSGLIAETVP